MKRVTTLLRWKACLVIGACLLFSVASIASSPENNTKREVKTSCSTCKRPVDQVGNDSWNHCGITYLSPLASLKAIVYWIINV